MRGEVSDALADLGFTAGSNSGVTVCAVQNSGYVGSVRGADIFLPEYSDS